MKTLREQLTQLEKSDFYPFHMPGHKRTCMYPGYDISYSHDITEIDGFDNLHHAEDLLLHEEEYASHVFGAEETFYLVNGSSCGILAAIKTVCDQNIGKCSRLLVARNSHKSTYNAIALNGVDVDYLIPDEIEEYSFSGGIQIEKIETALRQNQYLAVVITSPTYEGIISDIKAIVSLAHKFDIPVIVDEAHGAYLGIFGDDDFFPKSAVYYGADLVIQSTHKTMPALTQTALLHVNGSLVNRDLLKENLSLFQTSSPSYILMESISDSIHYCVNNREELRMNYRRNLIDFYDKTRTLRFIEVVDYDRNLLEDGKMQYKRDPGKLVIRSKFLDFYTGKNLYDDLRERYHLQMEMASTDYVIAMTSVMDKAEDFNRLFYALSEIDQWLFYSINSTFKEGNKGKENTTLEIKKENPMFTTNALMKIKDAMLCKKEEILLDDVESRICGEYIYVYPPGIPLLTPGEVITKELIDYIKTQINLKLNVMGLKSVNDKLYIKCVKE